MLVLARKQGESITIDNETTITVLEARNGTIRLGIEAPRQIPVMRTELLTPAQPSGELVEA